MSLLSTDITKVKRLSLREVKLPAPELRVEPILVERPPSEEIDKPKLIALAQRVIKGENSYSREEVIKRIKEATNVSQERAIISFKNILQAGAIEQTMKPDLYYLVGSTPF
jgi:hypothetical protein